MNKTLRLTLALLLIGIISICAVMIGRKAVGRTRLDLTEDKLYTLSEGTANILGSIGDPITFKLYYSQKAAIKQNRPWVRDWNNYYLYVRELLEQYVMAAKGKINLEVIDPRPYSDDEEQAMRSGVRRIPLSETEGFFFGLVATTELGKDKVIELFDISRQEQVEYDVSRMIVELTQRKKNKVGVISSLDVMGTAPFAMRMMQMQGRRPQPPWGIIQQLRATYDVTKVDLKEGEIPEDIEFLIVIHPKRLDEKAMFAIDQFVMNGKKLLVFTDPNCLSDRPPQDPRNRFASMSYRAESELNGLLSKWGVEMLPGEIAVDIHLATKTPLGRGPVALPIFLTFDKGDREEVYKQCVDSDEIIVSQFKDANLIFAGAMKKTHGAKSTIRPLLSTTKSGGTWKPKSAFELRPDNPDFVKNQTEAARKGNTQYMLACLIEGEIETNFPDGIEVPNDQEPTPTTSPASTQPATSQPATRRLDAIKTAKKGACVLVVSDVDCITDQFAYRSLSLGPMIRMIQIGDNASLVLNTLEYFSGSEDLITIRSRSSYRRRFIVFDEIEDKADEKTAEAAEEINTQIKKDQEELNNIVRDADGRNIGMLQQKVVARQRALEMKVRDGRKELRGLQSDRREQIEAMTDYLTYLNVLGTPILLLLIAITLAIFRFAVTKRYTSKRT